MTFPSDCPVPLPAGERVLLGHGGGGRLGADLVRDLFLPAFGDAELARLGDAAVLDVDGLRLAFTTDAFVVQPAFFPGADIGALAVHGTVNDLAMVGADPLALSVAFVLEEGLEMTALADVVRSAAVAAASAGVRVVAGDTKVVERGSADGLYVVTSGIGRVRAGREVGPDRLAPGDVVIVSGPVGSHGVAVLSRRAGLDFEVDVVSDTGPLTGVAGAALDVGGVHAMRDATRGGLATVLVELAEASGVRVEVREADVPVLDPVRAACGALGLDPLYVANEGVCVLVVAPEAAAGVLAAVRADPMGRRAAVVGEVREGPVGVELRTALGVGRPLRMLAGDQLPRIC